MGDQDQATRERLVDFRIGTIAAELAKGEQAAKQANWAAANYHAARAGVLASLRVERMLWETSEPEDRPPVTIYADRGLLSTDQVGK